MGKCHCYFLDMNEIVFRGNGIVFRGNEIVFRGNEIVFRGNEILFRGNEIVSRGQTLIGKHVPLGAAYLVGAANTLVHWWTKARTK